MFDVRPFGNDEVAHLGGLHGPDRSSPRRTRTFVAADDNAVVGAATVIWSSRHPDFISAMIDVSSEHRRRGVGSLLLKRLEQEAEIDGPLLFNVERATDSTAFLTSAGFETVMTSVTSCVDVSEVVVGLPETEASEVEVWASKELTEEIVDLYEEIYRARHTWVGRYTPPENAPWIAFAGPPLDVDGAIQSAHSHDRATAVASLHSGPFAEGADAFLAPTSVLEGSFDDRTRVLAAVLTRCLRAAIGAGVATVNVEVDSTYDDLAAVINDWPLTNSTTRDAWRRPGL